MTNPNNDWYLSYPGGDYHDGKFHLFEGPPQLLQLDDETQKGFDEFMAVVEKRREAHLVTHPHDTE